MVGCVGVPRPVMKRECGEGTVSAKAMDIPAIVIVMNTIYIIIVMNMIMIMIMFTVIIVYNYIQIV